MVKELLSPLESVLTAVKMCNISSIPSFPSFRIKKIKGIEIEDVSSEEDAFSNAIGCLLSNKRTLIISNNFKPNEIIGRIASMRLPLICVSFSQNNAKFFKDSGWQVIFAESCQELMDRVIQNFKISEDSSVLLPVIIIYDMENIREVVSSPSDKSIKKFVQNLNLKHMINPKNPSAIGVPIRNEDRVQFEMQHISALENSNKMSEKINEKWNTMFRRKYNDVDYFMAEDAESVIVCSGPVSGTVKNAVEKLRSEKIKVGAVIIKRFNPFPEIVLPKKVSVIESPMLGSFGNIHSEISKSSNPTQFFIIKNPSEKDIIDIFKSENEEKIYWVV